MPVLLSRYTAEYPASPLELKLRNPKGLSSGDVQQLAQQLTETATASAQLEQVCVFDLVGVCQVRMQHCTQQLLPA